RTDKAATTDKPSTVTNTQHNGDIAHQPITTTPKADAIDNSNIAPPKSPEPPPEPTPEIRAVSPVAAGAIAHANVIPRASVLTPMPMSFTDGWMVRPFAAIGGTVSLVSATGETGSQKSDPRGFSGLSYLAGLDFPLSET